MTNRDDHQLLAEFARENSEAAFAALVERHVNVVYSTALRSVGHAHAAQEISQAVFIILARKANSLGAKTVLGGWLHQTTRLTAANFLRGEIRRQQREQEAYMRSTLNEPDATVWLQIAPLLDDALGKLGERDRNALVLRFFENKNLREVGLALGASEDAAKMRVNRALEKLRKIFTKRGVTLSATLIAGTVAANSVQAAPVGLAATVATAAAKGTAFSATLTTLIKTTMETMTWLKLKFAISVGVTALLVGGAATVAISQTGGGGDKWTPQEILKKSHDAYAALSSYSDRGTVVATIASQSVTTTFNTRLQRPNLYRIDWTQEPVLNKGAVWSAGSGDYFQVTAADALMLATRQQKNDRPQKMPSLKMALALAAPFSGSAASTISGIFFNQNLGDFVEPAASGHYPLKKENDAKVGDVDCYVISSAMIDLSKVPEIGKPGTVSAMLWIGKKDFLIRQSRTKYVEKVDSVASSDQAIDEAIKQSLKIQNKPATPEAVAAMRPQMKIIMQQVQSTLKSGFESGVVSIQTHENIVVNRKFSPADFAR
jgi:RNA polymerase sigma factor (sigma-70 family)